MLEVNNLPTNAGCGFDSWVEKIPCRRKWQPTQYSCLENPMDWGRATVHRVAKSWTWLRQLSMHIHPINWRPWEWKLRFLREEDIPIAGIWNVWFSRLPAWTADFRFWIYQSPPNNCVSKLEKAQREEKETKTETDKDRMGSMSLIQKKTPNTHAFKPCLFLLLLITSKQKTHESLILEVESQSVGSRIRHYWQNGGTAPDPSPHSTGTALGWRS